MGVTVSFPSSDLVKSWGGECDGHTRGLVRQARIQGVGPRGLCPPPSPGRGGGGRGQRSAKGGGGYF